MENLHQHREAKNWQQASSDGGERFSEPPVLFRHAAAGTHSLVPRLKFMELVADFKFRVPCVKIIGEDARTRCYDISWENLV